MEGDRSLNNLNQQLNRYVFQMQAEVGKSGKSLHQISSDFLAMKAKNEELAHAIEALEIPGADSLNPEQFHLYCETLERLQVLRARALQGGQSPADHPWQPFAHPDHHPDEHELLLRTLRFVAIQLSKFWVEVQSFPLFLNTLDHLSLAGVEGIFHWMKSNPPWHEIIEQPRVITALTQPNTRTLLFDFVRNVKSARALRDRASMKQSLTYLSTSQIQEGYALLGQGLTLAKKYKLETNHTGDLRAKIAQEKSELDQIHRVQGFFSLLTLKTGLPGINTYMEAGQVFRAKEFIQNIPKRILPWRQSQILAPSQSVRIQAFQDRAKPLLEARKRLDQHFKLNASVHAEKLRDLATDLTQAGFFARMKAPYKEAVQSYKNLLKEPLHPKGHPKETPLQMAEKLNEWANFMEQNQAFEKNGDVKKSLGSLFNGIDTDFALAVEANTWATQLRSDLTIEGSSYTEPLLSFIYRASEDTLQTVVNYLGTEEAHEVLKILKDSETFNDVDLNDTESKLKGTLAELRSLLDVLNKLEIPAELPLFTLDELQKINEDIIFLMSQMDINSEISNCLRTHYYGIDTDLSLIEQGAAYTHSIEHAEIPQSLKRAFLSSHGPQRFGENRSLVIPAFSTLQALKELLQKLEAVTRGQVSKVLDSPVPKLLAQIQQSLKQPALLGDWVEYIRCEREARLCGLGMLLDFFDAHSFLTPEFVTGYRLAFHASLLKKALGRTQERSTPDVSSRTH